MLEFWAAVAGFRVREVRLLAAKERAEWQKEKADSQVDGVIRRSKSPYLESLRSGSSLGSTLT
jgi:hypothetical protein